MTWLKVLGTIGTLLCALGLNQMFAVSPFCAYSTCERVLPFLVDFNKYIDEP